MLLAGKIFHRAQNFNVFQAYVTVTTVRLTTFKVNVQGKKIRTVVCLSLRPHSPVLENF
jgi:hypothetical protein